MFDWLDSATRSLGLVAIILTAGCGRSSAKISPQGGPTDASGADGEAGDESKAEVGAAFPMAASAEIAQRLSTFLWGTDAPASLGAELGPEPSPARIADTASRMLKDPRARAGIGAFFRWWLDLDALASMPKQDPEGILTPALRQDMSAEAAETGASVVLDGDGFLTTLLEGKTTFVNQRLAEHYGIAGVTGEAFVPVAFDGQERIGILGGAGVLTRVASFNQPTWAAKRTRLMTSVLLCQTLPQPPPLGVMKTDPAQPLRSQMIEVTKSPSCMQCHSQLNEPGFAFMKFDSFGRYRPTDAGGAIDTSGTVPPQALPDAPTFDGQPSLMRLLSQRAEVRRCVAAAGLHFAVDRSTSHPTPAPDDAAASLSAVFDAFEASGWNLRALALAVTQSEAFLRPAPTRWPAR